MTNSETNNSRPLKDDLRVKSKLIVNLSSKTLTEDETNILCKGLKFCPTPKCISAGDVRKEMDTFHNKLRTIQFFNKDGAPKMSQKLTITKLSQTSQN